MATGEPRLPTEKPRWPYFGSPQKRLVLTGFGMWIGTALPWLFLRPFGIWRHASPLAASWVLWAGLMVVAGAMARWLVLATLSAALGGGTAFLLAGWQLFQIVDRCGLDSLIRLRCVPGPGLLIVTGTAVFAMTQGWQLFQTTRAP